MSRLNDLLRRLENSDPALAKDLKREVDALAGRRAFGLNFERHVPEAVQLPGRPVRRGDKVRILPPRGSKASSGDGTLWRVLAILKDGGDLRTASLQSIDGTAELKEELVEDLVVVAEFRDPIYPGLVSTGKVERGGNKPYQVVINAENYHALQTLLFTHRAKVDAIYIDPPYNTGAKDWKYNNDYVDSEDLYRHSRWLAFMERRLHLAKGLLNPLDSVLIVAIDENEFPRLLLLIEQLFPEGRISTISVSINPKGTPENGFARVDEYLIFVAFGDAAPARVFDPMLGEPPATDSVRVRWRGLTRTGANGVRSKSPGAYYPIFISTADGSIHSSGEVPPDGDDGLDIVAPAGTVAVWPTPRPNGTPGRWSVIKESFDELFSQGAVKTGRVRIERGEFPLWYLTEPMLEKLKNGEIVETGRDSQGAMIVEWSDATNKKSAPRTLWHRAAHSASEHGTGILAKLLPGVAFDFAKSLYAVEDALRLYVGDKPDAIVVDFFAGSGTTAHAVARLNRQDSGRRRSISITNNEASESEELRLRREGFRPGDDEWEQWGICDYITKPRVAAAVTGTTPSGNPIQGDYTFTDEFPMADGFEENVEFFTLTYEAPLRVSSNREFAKIAPLLWLRAGAEGRRIDDISSGWEVTDTYGVIVDLNQAGAFLQAIAKLEGIRIAFIVTDEDRLFESVVRELPDGVEPVRMYEAYLQNFEIETSRSAL